MHEIRRIDGRREFRTSRNVLRIGKNKFYDRENEIPMEIPEFKRSGIRIIVEFHGIPSRFPNQVSQDRENVVALLVLVCPSTNRGLSDSWCDLL